MPPRTKSRSIRLQILIAYQGSLTISKHRVEYLKAICAAAVIGHKVKSQAVAVGGNISNLLPTTECLRQRDGSVQAVVDRQVVHARSADWLLQVESEKAQEEAAAFGGGEHRGAVDVVVVEKTAVWLNEAATAGLDSGIAVVCEVN